MLKIKDMMDNAPDADSYHIPHSLQPINPEVNKTTWKERDPFPEALRNANNYRNNVGKIKNKDEIKLIDIGIVEWDESKPIEQFIKSYELKK